MKVQLINLVHDPSFRHPVAAYVAMWFVRIRHIEARNGLWERDCATKKRDVVHGRRRRFWCSQLLCRKSRRRRIRWSRVERLDVVARALCGRQDAWAAWRQDVWVARREGLTVEVRALMGRSSLFVCKRHIQMLLTLIDRSIDQCGNFVIFTRMYSRCTRFTAHQNVKNERKP